MSEKNYQYTNLPCWSYRDNKMRNRADVDASLLAITTHDGGAAMFVSDEDGRTFVIDIGEVGVRALADCLGKVIGGAV